MAIDRQSSRQGSRQSRQAADPSDLGTLAGLNGYGHDWLRGKAVEVYWESQCYGAMMEAE